MRQRSIFSCSGCPLCRTAVIKPALLNVAGAFTLGPEVGTACTTRTQSRQGGFSDILHPFYVGVLRARAKIGRWRGCVASPKSTPVAASIISRSTERRSSYFGTSWLGVIRCNNRIAQPHFAASTAKMRLTAGLLLANVQPVSRTDEAHEATHGPFV